MLSYFKARAEVMTYNELEQAIDFVKKTLVNWCYDTTVPDAHLDAIRDEYHAYINEKVARVARIKAMAA
jgi:hypothetical protein